jgi:hypothetical protein
MRGQAILTVATLALVSSACFQQRRKLVLPPAAPVAAQPLPNPEIETPPSMEAQIQLADLERVTLPPSPQIRNLPPQPAPRKRPATTPAGGSANAAQPSPGGEPETPAGAATTPTPAPPPTPQLGEMLTDDRRRQYEAEFGGYVSRATAVVNRATRRPSALSPRQKETVVRIQTFLQQAEESKLKDVVTAVQLARRADLLAQDLLRTLR